MGFLPLCGVSCLSYSSSYCYFSLVLPNVSGFLKPPWFIYLFFYPSSYFYLSSVLPNISGFLNPPSCVYSFSFSYIVNFLNGMHGCCLYPYPYMYFQSMRFCSTKFKLVFNFFFYFMQWHVKLIVLKS